MLYGLENKDIVTLTIALHGAGLSTFVMYQSMSKERKRVKIECESTFYAIPMGTSAPK
jgi:hypothetical protein